MIDNIIVAVIGVPILTLFILMAGDSIFKWKWTCKTFGWHDGDDCSNGYGFDGCNIHSVCSKCGKSVMQDGQGNWF